MAIANPEPSLTAHPVNRPEDVAFIDPAHGWIWVDAGAAMGGDAGTLIATSDGGVRWTAVGRASATWKTPCHPLSGHQVGIFLHQPDERLDDDQPHVQGTGIPVLHP